MGTVKHHFLLLWLYHTTSKAHILIKRDFFFFSVLITSKENAEDAVSANFAHLQGLSKGYKSNFVRVVCFLAQTKSLIYAGERNLNNFLQKKK